MFEHMNLSDDYQILGIADQRDCGIAVEWASPGFIRDAEYWVPTPDSLKQKRNFWFPVYRRKEGGAIQG